MGASISVSPSFAANEGTTPHTLVSATFQDAPRLAVDEILGFLACELATSELKASVVALAFAAESSKNRYRMRYESEDTESTDPATRVFSAECLEGRRWTSRESTGNFVCPASDRSDRSIRKSFNAFGARNSGHAPSTATLLSTVLGFRDSRPSSSRKPQRHLFPPSPYCSPPTRPRSRLGSPQLPHRSTIFPRLPSHLNAFLGGTSRLCVPPSRSRR